MSQKITNPSFLDASLGNQQFPSSQFNNTSLNILNKISAISLKNISKNSSFDINEFSFLNEDKQQQNPAPIIEEYPFKGPKINMTPLNVERKINSPKYSNDFGKISLEKKEPAPYQKKQDESFENKQINISLVDKSSLFKSKENFDFLIKDWAEYFNDEEPSKIKVIYIACLK